MHDIKLIRKQPEKFAKKLESRNSQTDLRIVLNLDNKLSVLTLVSLFEVRFCGFML